MTAASFLPEGELHMNALLSIVFLCLLLWVEPARAESAEYSLQVSRHRNVQLDEGEVDRILEAASNLLKQNHCDVTFRRNGQVQVFASPHTPDVINTPAQRNAVYRELGDVKVVSDIKFCRLGLGDTLGCAWPRSAGRKSMIVMHEQVDRNLRHILWAHEFGHRTGLKHRADPESVMTICDLAADQVKVTPRECDCFLSGPGHPCRRREIRPQCPDR